MKQAVGLVFEVPENCKMGWKEDAFTGKRRNKGEKIESA